MGMGYQGFCRIYGTGPTTNPSVFLTTGASVNLMLEPIFSDSSVWGAGWYNGSTAHYADNAIRYEGTINLELQLGVAGRTWDYLANWVIAQRAFPRSMDISPDGTRMFQYRTVGDYVNWSLFDVIPPTGIWNTSAGFSTTAASFVTVAAGAIALDRVMSDPAEGTAFSDYAYLRQVKGVIASDCALFSPTGPLNPGGTSMNPIPYWKTKAEIIKGTYNSATLFTNDGDGIQDGLEAVEWNIDVTQNQVVVYTCDGTRLPTALMMGAMNATGSVLLFCQDGVFDPIFGPTGAEGTLTSPYLIAENSWFRAKIATGDAAPNDYCYIMLPAIVVESDAYDISAPSAVTNRTFNMRGLGGRCDANDVVMPPCIMSDYQGTYIEPPSP